MKQIITTIFSCAMALHMASGVAHAQKRACQEPDSLKFERELNLGYDQLSRKRSTAAVDVIYSDQVNDNSFTNSNHALRGKLASLSTLQSSGQPGADDLTFVIRGKSSSASNTPLILVDGFESAIGHLSQEEIESVTILKDAVATAIYGIRGANGVVLVTTKMGCAERLENGKLSTKPKITARAEFGIMQPVDLPDFVDAATYVRMVNEARANDGLAPQYSPEQVAGFEAGNQPHLYPNVDWLDEMLKSQTTMQSASVQAEGAFKKMRYYAMVNYTGSDGLFRHTDKSDRYTTNQEFRRVNFRLNTSVDVFKHTRLDLRIGGRLQDDNDPEVGSDTYYTTLIKTPAARYAKYNENGSYYGNNKYRANPLGTMESRGYQDRHTRSVNFNGALTRNLDKITPGLKAKGEISFMNTFTATEKFKAGFAVYQPGMTQVFDEEGNATWQEGYVQYGKDSPIKFDKRETWQTRTQTYRASMLYDRRFGDHLWHAVLVGERSEVVRGNDAEAYHMQGINAHVNYSYKDKYLADFVAAYSGSNTYSASERYGFFPALGLGWIMSEENFMEDQDYIDYFKWRLSYGLTGSDAMNGYRRFMYYGKYSSQKDPYRWGEKANITDWGKKPTDVPNPDATFETGYVFNVGFDTKFLKHFDMSFDFFAERRHDVLNGIGSDVSGLFGIGVPQINYGEVENHGVEVTLGYNRQINKDWKVEVDFNYGYAKNEIKKILEYTYDTTPRTGADVNAIYGYKTDGLYQTAEEVAGAPQNSLDPVQVGDVKIIDKNKDGIIDDYDKAIIGNSFPRSHFGLQARVSYKGWYGYCQFDGQGGYDMLMNNSVYRPLNDGDGNISTYAADNYWTAERGEKASLPRLTTVGNVNNTTDSSYWIEKGDYVRLRTLELGYNFPKSWVKKAYMNGAKLYVRGHNLLTFDNFEDGVDPEVKTSFPMMRTYNVGVQVVF